LAIGKIFACFCFAKTRDKLKFKPPFGRLKFLVSLLMQIILYDKRLTLAGDAIKNS